MYISVHAAKVWSEPHSWIRAGDCVELRFTAVQMYCMLNNISIPCRLLSFYTHNTLNRCTCHTTASTTAQRWQRCHRRTAQRSRWCQQTCPFRSSWTVPLWTNGWGLHPWLVRGSGRSTGIPRVERRRYVEDSRPSRRGYLSMRTRVESLEIESKILKKILAKKMHDFVSVRR